jgi:hypothetical protein
VPPKQIRPKSLADDLEVLSKIAFQAGVAPVARAEWRGRWALSCALRGGATRRRYDARLVA